MYLRAPKHVMEEIENQSQEQKDEIDQRMTAQENAAKDWIKKEMGKADIQRKAYEERRK